MEEVIKAVSYIIIWYNLNGHIKMKLRILIVTWKR